MRPAGSSRALPALLPALLPAVLPAVLPVLLAAPAHADGELGLSYDGRHWHDRLERPLFDPALRWVPGDVRTARFYVRNLAPDEGALSVEVERTERDALEGSGYLHVTARADGGAWSELHGDDLAELVSDDVLASGRAVPVDVRVVLDAAAPNRTMVLSSALDFRVVLRDARAIAPATAGGGAGGGAGTGPSLPATGSAVPSWLPPLALGLLGSGLWLVVRRRADGTTEAAGPDLEPGRCAGLEERLPLT